MHRTTVNRLILNNQFAGVNILEIYSEEYIQNSEFIFRRMLKGGLRDQINETEL